MTALCADSLPIAIKLAVNSGNSQYRSGFVEAFRFQPPSPDPATLESLKPLR